MQHGPRLLGIFMLCCQVTLSRRKTCGVGVLDVFILIPAPPDIYVRSNKLVRAMPSPVCSNRWTIHTLTYSLPSTCTGGRSAPSQLDCKMYVRVCIVRQFEHTGECIALTSLFKWTYMSGCARINMQTSSTSLLCLVFFDDFVNVWCPVDEHANLSIPNSSET